MNTGKYKDALHVHSMLCIQNKCVIMNDQSVN